MRDFLKSIIFNIAFYLYTALCCFGLVWSFFLPRKWAYIAVLLYFRGIVWVERIFLGLDYRVTGLENLPKDGRYILALKHYSAYETLKLPVIFGDIAIILKRELTWIPFWGWYTLKLGMIPVDRGGGHKAIASLIEGGKRVIAQNRPILIFPQGTRVRLSETVRDKPYKYGTARIAETLHLPVVPVALNSAVFWPKHRFIKRGGVVDFKILPVLPAGMPPMEMLKQLETVLEKESLELVRHAQETPCTAKDYIPRWLRLAFWGVVVLAGLWMAWWQFAAAAVEKRLGDLKTAGVISSPYAPQIAGFPLKMHVTWPDVAYQGTTLRVLEARVWPVPGGVVQLDAPMGFTHSGDPMPFIADTAQGQIKLPVFGAVEINHFSVTSGDIALEAQGAITLPLDRGPAEGQLQTNLRGYAPLLDLLVENKVMKKNEARIARSLFETLAATQGHSDTIIVPINIHDDVVYASFIRLFRLGYARAPAE